MKHVLQLDFSFRNSSVIWFYSGHQKHTFPNLSDKHFSCTKQNKNLFFSLNNFFPLNSQHPTFATSIYGMVPVVGPMRDLNLCLMSYSAIFAGLAADCALHSPGVPLNPQAHRFTVKQVKRDQCQQRLTVTTLLAHRCQACLTLLHSHIHSTGD